MKNRTEVRVRGVDLTAKAVTRCDWCGQDHDPIRPQDDDL